MCIMDYECQGQKFHVFAFYSFHIMIRFKVVLHRIKFSLVPQDLLVFWDKGEFQDRKETKEIQVRCLKIDPHLENLENQDNLDPED